MIGQIKYVSWTVEDWRKDVQDAMNARGLTQVDWLDRHRWKPGCKKRQRAVTKSLNVDGDGYVGISL